MQFGFVLPGGDPRLCAELAYEAEEAGWDGVFVPDAISIETADTPAFPMYDPWVLLSAMAMRTERVRLGPLIAAVPRQQPWKLAKETVSVDHLSNGRLVLPVGLGAAEADGGFYKVGEPMELRPRAERLDETLAILAGLWSGKPFTHSGKHYAIQQMTTLPAPVQSPRIPIWAVVAWPRIKSVRRALQWDGIIPQKSGVPAPARILPEDVRAIRAFVAEHRAVEWPFDIVVNGETPGNDQTAARAMVQTYADAGATWWIDAMWDAIHEPERVRTRIQQGPPQVS